MYQGHGETSNLCWACTISEAVEWFTGNSTSIQQMAINQFNKGGMYDQYQCNKGLSMVAVRDNIRDNYYLDNSRYRVGDRQINSTKNNIVTAEFIKEEIDMGRPLILNIYNASHAVVIVGYDYSDLNDKIVICQDSGDMATYSCVEKFSGISTTDSLNRIIAFERSW